MPTVAAAGGSCADEGAVCELGTACGPDLTCAAGAPPPYLQDVFTEGSVQLFPSPPAAADPTPRLVGAYRAAVGPNGMALPEGPLKLLFFGEFSNDGLAPVVEYSQLVLSDGYQYLVTRDGAAYMGPGTAAAAAAAVAKARARWSARAARFVNASAAAAAGAPAARGLRRKVCDFGLDYFTLLLCNFLLFPSPTRPLASPPIRPKSWTPLSHSCWATRPPRSGCTSPRRARRRPPRRARTCAASSTA